MRNSLAADGETLPILAYPIPDLSERHTRRTRRGRKKGPISVGFATGRPERENLRALAQCLGMSLTQFVSCAVTGMKFRLADELGIPSWQFYKLTEDERQQIATLLDAVSGSYGYRPIHVESTN